MYTKAIAVLALVAAVQCGAPVAYVDSPHVGAQAEQTFRGFGGLSSVSKQQKAVDSAFSSVRKTDTRVTNDAAAVAYAQPAAVYAQQPTYAAAPLGYAQPLARAPLQYGGYPYQVAAAPAVAYAQPQGVAYATKTLSAAPALAYAHQPAVAYAHQPAVAYAHQPAVAYAHQPAAVAYAQPAVAHVAKAVAPVHTAYASPLIAKSVAPNGLLGVAYSAVSPAVATLNFNGYGISYGY